MKLKVIRKIIDGTLTPYVFDVRACSFLVKNFSDDAAYVSFEADAPESECIKILSMVCESVGYNENSAYYTDTVYVKATGEVEVEALNF